MTPRTLLATFVAPISLCAAALAQSADGIQALTEYTGAPIEILTLEDANAPFTGRSRGFREWPGYPRYVQQAAPTVSAESLERLDAMYRQALAEERLEDAIALRDAIRALRAQPMQILDVSAYPVEIAPAGITSLTEFRGLEPLTVRWTVTGSTTGTVWGSGPYTDDSDLGTAAVHAGLIAPGETKELAVTLKGQQSSYSSSTENGITTRDYNEWGGSFDLAPAAEYPSTAYVVDRAIARIDELPSDKLTSGTCVLVRLTGSTTGSVWGNGLYTGDSSLATAAVHAGVLQDGETGIVQVYVREGQAAYESSTANNVTSSSWGSYTLSFEIVPLAAQDPRVRVETFWGLQRQIDYDGLLPPQ